MLLLQCNKKPKNDQKAAAGRTLAAIQWKADNDQKAAAGHPAVVAVTSSDSANKNSD